MIKLEMQKVTLGYNHHPVLQEINLKATPGEMVGLIGPNGCGKSTIIKALSHVINPLAGQVIVDGRNIFEPKQMAKLGFIYKSIGRG